MQECVASPAHVLGITSQLQRLRATQTLPFAQVVHEYAASLQHNRELQVRASVWVQTSPSGPPRATLCSRGGQ